MRSAIVLGSGMVGVATALHLRRRSWSVALVDRKPPGQETSYGNAVIIQSEALRPYPMPRDWRSLQRIATGRTNDVRYRMATLHHHLGPLLSYWWHSAPGRHDRISAAYAEIISRAAREHEDLIGEAGAGALVRREGFRVLYREQSAFDAEVAAAEALHAVHGVKFSVLTAHELKQAEPGLIDAGLGGLHWLEPWTVSDPGGLVAAYAKLFERSGGTIVHGDAATLTERNGVWSVTARDGRIDAEAVVVALGPWSPNALRKFGYRIPMVRKRGYHRHYAGGSTLRLPLRDVASGYVIAPMKNGLRIITGAELAMPDEKPTPVQLARAEQAARQIIDLGRPVEAEPWFGTRPCMPDMLPVLGPASRHKRLWMHFGHGHQGFTLGPVTGRLLAELMSGETPSVDVSAYRADRFEG
ncbi:FAD-binding oxidoreductase [Bradyrhizobium sp. ARR65]|uniref:NAD(P)/FAD-dependent oxidoreductase n=1 Tax=Bradyrhizobium sp. ARR65 TaxID=1040989 RepID=UPI0004675CBE|nr:FAD-binding oxidoreductase [Bradyrhizobium sp. ARR65]